MKTAAAHHADAARRVSRAALSLMLVARLHVDLCRCMSAACRA
ncbi:hypothetical protein [Streptomyces sp. NPDC003393]